jgi:hypothetical protein
VDQAEEQSMIVRCLAGLLLGLMLLLSQARAQPEPDPPSIQVAVEIRADSLRRTLGARRADAEQLLAAQLAQLLQQRHPFIAWKSDTAVTPTMGKLVAAIQDRPHAGGGRPVLLAWKLALAQGERELALPEVAIYSPFDMRASAHEPRDFALHAGERLRAVVQTEGFDREAFQRVVSLLPIARGVEAVAGDRVVLLPLRWKHLRLGAGSRIEVEVRQQTGDGEISNRAELSGVQERRRGSAKQRGMIQAAVVRLSSGSQQLPLDAQWHARMEQLLRGKEVLCFLKHFQPDEFGDEPLEPGS